MTTPQSRLKLIADKESQLRRIDELESQLRKREADLFAIAAGITAHRVNIRKAILRRVKIKKAILGNHKTLTSAVESYERLLIRAALRAAPKKSPTIAARYLGMSYQGLCYAIQSRHRPLLKNRSKVRKRTQKKRIDKVDGQGVR